MDNRSEVRDFLITRRARVSPEQAGVLSVGSRRVPGLRRSEVAQLAGVSIEYYTRMERGDLGGVSETVLDAVAGALRLDEAERTHLHDLAAATKPRAGRRRSSAGAPELRPSIARLLASLSGIPAFVRNARLDVLAINSMGRALYSYAYENATSPARHPDRVNLALFCFLDPRAHLLYPSWDEAADTSVALLRTEAGRDPYDRGLTELVGELSTRSEEFRTRWAAHDVRLHRAGTKRFRHPVVGDLELTFDALEIPTAPGLTLTVYSAEPATAAADNLSLLASWTATQAEATDHGGTAHA